MRSAAGFCVVSVAAALLQSCSLNPFERPAAGPAVTVEPASATTAAAPKKRPEAAALLPFDANGDGEISRLELETMLAANFKKEDANADEVLDVIEARALNERLRREQNISPVFDWNADGKIDFAEFATQWRTLFERADRDRDGVVDADEVEGPAERTPKSLPKPTFSGKDRRPPGT